MEAGPGGDGGGTFARVLRDALTPSSMAFTARNRGFWAPSSMLVSIPKAAWGQRRACHPEGLGLGPGPRVRLCTALPLGVTF